MNDRRRTAWVHVVPAAVIVLAAVATVAASAQAAPWAAARLSVRTTEYGKALFGPSGKVVYVFGADRGSTSHCYGACAKAWPVYYAKGGLTAGAGIKRSLLATTKRRDGRRQVTYAGRPLYYYVGDTKPGQIRCQKAAEFGGTWLIVRPSGRLVR